MGIVTTKRTEVHATIASENDGKYCQSMIINDTNVILNVRRLVYLIVVITSQPSELHYE